MIHSSFPGSPRPGTRMRLRLSPPNCEVRMAETETKVAPIRLERDGNVAAMVLSNPPLNLFGDDAWGALVSCIEEVEGSDARALVWRADGDIFTGGVDVNSFKRVQEEGSASDSFGSLIPVVQRLE